MRYLHTTLYVSDLEASIRFYEELAGLRVVTRFTAGPQEFVFLANGQEETQLELICDGTGAPRVREGISIGFEAEDLERHLELVQERGIKHSGIIQPNPHARFFFVDDPDGLSVQFMQKS